MREAINTLCHINKTTTFLIWQAGFQKVKNYGRHQLFAVIFLVEEELEDNKGTIRIRISKNNGDYHSLTFLYLIRNGECTMREAINTLCHILEICIYSVTLSKVSLNGW
jgi:hypothetical protein